MTTDREPKQVEKPEASTYTPQRDLPMPTYEFQVPSNTAGSVSGVADRENAREARREVASLANFFIR